MDTAYFFADESGAHTGGRYFVVAGAVLNHYRDFVKAQLEHVERVSFKGKADWKGTRHPGQRVRYITESMELKHLQGAMFHATYWNNRREYWACTVDALALAIVRFAANRHSIIRHQGFTEGSRIKLEAALKARTGCSLEVQPAGKRAEIRFANALCGYCMLMHLNEGNTVTMFPDLLGLVVDLKSEAPPKNNL